MGNTIVVTTYFDHEVLDKREAVEAGEALSGKVVVKVKQTIDARNLNLELSGSEKSSVIGKSISKEEHRFFQASLQLYKHKESEKIKPNNYVFPFEIPLPASLPSSMTSKESLSKKGTFSIEYDLRLVNETTGKFYYKRAFSVVSAERVSEERHPCLFQPDPLFVDTLGLDGAGQIFMGGRVQDAYLLHGQDLQVSVACRNRSTCDLERIDVRFEEEYSWKTDSTEAFARIKLFDRADVTDLLPRLRLDRIRRSQVEEGAINDETIARRMFQDLKNLDNFLAFSTPKSARESYNGSLIKISHFIKIVLVTSVKPDSGYPVIRLPVRLGSKSYDNLQEAPPSYTSVKNEVKFPRATATNDCILVGKDVAAADESKKYGYGAMDGGPSLETLLEDLALSMDEYEFLSDKMKDIEWAIFFGSFSPQEFGTIIAHIDFGVVQTKVGVLIAKTFGGDFTCHHCAEAILNSSEAFRSNMAECLLPYCVDLAENNEAIRNHLSDFEQIIVALHALDVQEEEEDDYHSTPRSSRPSSRWGSRAREEDEKTELSGSVSPEKDDICMGDNQHPGTNDFLFIVRDVVEEGAFQEFAPAVYRRIRKRLKGRRFLIRPFEELPHYWRIASDREKIEYCGECFDRDVENLKKTGLPSHKDDWAGGNEEGKGWQDNLREGGNEWVLAMTVHSYATHIYDNDDGDDGPAPMDICFGKRHHPGNEAMKKAIRKHLPEYSNMAWAPPVYKAIKADLNGRRYFVPLEGGGWRLATQQERRAEMGKYYDTEKNKPKLTPVVEPPAYRRKSSNRSKPRKSRTERPKPLEEDVCFGLADHPGTKALHNAIVQSLNQFESTPWGPPVYKVIRAQMEDVRFFIRTEVDAPWKEASAQQRVERVRQQFELSRKKMRMKIGVEAMVS